MEKQKQDIKKLQRALNALLLAHNIIDEVVENTDDDVDATDLFCICEDLARQMDLIENFLDEDDE